MQLCRESGKVFDPVASDAVALNTFATIQKVFYPVASDAFALNTFASIQKVFYPIALDAFALDQLHHRDRDLHQVLNGIGNEGCNRQRLATGVATKGRLAMGVAHFLGFIIEFEIRVNVLNGIGNEGGLPKASPRGLGHRHPLSMKALSSTSTVCSSPLTSIVEVLDFKAMSHLVIDISVASRLKIIISLAILEDWEDADFVVVRDVGHLPFLLRRLFPWHHHPRPGRRRGRDFHRSLSLGVISLMCVEVFWRHPGPPGSHSSL